MLSSRQSPNCNFLSIIRVTNIIAGVFRQVAQKKDKTLLTQFLNDLQVKWMLLVQHTETKNHNKFREYCNQNFKKPSVCIIFEEIDLFLQFHSKCYVCFHLLSDELVRSNVKNDPAFFYESKKVENHCLTAKEEIFFFSPKKNWIAKKELKTKMS